MQLLPFRHEIVDLRLADDGILDRACATLRKLRQRDEGWTKYRNDSQYYYTLSHDVAIEHDELNDIRRLITGLSLVSRVSSMFGIANLEIDPTGWETGFCAFPVGGYQGCHIESALHPQTLKQRRVTAIMFLNSCKNGATCLWDADAKNVVARIDQSAGGILLFENSDVSFSSVELCGEERYVFTASYYTHPLSKCPYRTRSLYLPVRK